MDVFRQPPRESSTIRDKGPFMDGNWPIEDSPRQATGNLHRKEVFHFQIRSLTPPQAAGNALAFAVQKTCITKG